ncbi:MAG TPA: ABC transporter permease subunit [Spirochaetes bacterium]|nr:ABC transporter permease subunit [Spirochaetota bacterium]
MKKDTAFNLILLSTLTVIILFLLILIFSVVGYINWNKAAGIFLSREILFAIKLSLITSTVSSVLAMALAVPAALALSRLEFFGKSVVDTLIDLPIIISPVALGAVLLVFLNNTSLGRFIERNIFEFTFEVSGIILAQFIVILALAIRLLKSTFDGIDTRYENVIRTLGATRSKAVFFVTLPMAKQGIFAAFVLTWTRAIGEFGATVTLAGAAKMKTETLPVAIFLSLAGADVQRAMVIILILFFIAVLVLFAVRSIGKRGLYY